ncbi:MAG TPA: hypothetical protein DDY32_10480 [Desulfobulbaceae bacterium]|nr:hypothetical protein [Desulfobulbaceae bacterium]
MDRRWWIILLVIILSGCAVTPTGRLDDGGSADGRGRRLVMWMLSDIQPPTPAKRIQFEHAIDDVNTLTEQMDFAVIAGDLLKSRSQDEVFAWFLATRERANVPVWYEIAGNHDVRTGERFRRYFPNPSYYAVEIGNLLLLLLSDELPSSETDISDRAFNWWREMVECNQDRIIITVTHGQLEGSGLLGSSIGSRIVVGSKRFEEVLRQRRVAIWASGHTHLPQGMPGTVSRREDLGGTLFVNVSSIDEGFLMDSQSRFFYFEDGSDMVAIRSRNHSKGRFDRDLDIDLALGKPFVWQGEGPRVIP